MCGLNIEVGARAASVHVVLVLTHVPFESGSPTISTPPSVIFLLAYLCHASNLGHCFGHMSQFNFVPYKVLAA